jgi:hypothetical protein
MKDMESQEFSIPSVQTNNRTVRLIFEYQGDEVQLVNQQKVRMIRPTTSVQPQNDEQANFWYELKNSQDQSIFRQAVPNPISFDTEVFSNDEGEASVYRQRLEQSKGTFILLIPDLPESDSVLLFSQPLEPSARSDRPTELGRFNLIKEEGE